MNTLGGKILIRIQNNCFLPQFVESASQEGILRLFLIHTTAIPSQMVERSVRPTKLTYLLKFWDFKGKFDFYPLVVKLGVE